MPAKDITTQRFGRLVVIRQTEERNNQGIILWECLCDCGTTMFTIAIRLKSGQTKSCGCLRGANKLQIEGQRFGRLVALRPTTERRNNGSYVVWECLCDCGALHYATATALKFGHVKSCGCLNSDKVRERMTTHGKTRNPEFSSIYGTWNNMIQRCTYLLHPSYHRYGAKGVTVYAEWQGKNGFETFLADIGQRPSPEHSLDRWPNKTGNYEPNNVRWATVEEQANNKTDNVLITAFGETRTLAQWSRLVNIKRETINSRLKRWSPEEALTRPVQLKSNRQ